MRARSLRVLSSQLPHHGRHDLRPRPAERLSASGRADVSGFVAGLLSVPAPIAYLLIGLLVFAEAAVFVGFVLPGETAVLLGGVLASTGRLSLPALLILVVLAAIAGDSVGFEVGKHFGPRVLATRPLRNQAGKIHRAQRFLRERAGRAVFVGRFTAFLRAVIPGLAGASRMPYRTFLVFNAAGALVWGSGVTLLGFFAGGSYVRVEQALGRGTAGLTALVVLVGLVAWLRVRHRRSAVRNETVAPG